jgi:hypothetical protein
MRYKNDGLLCYGIVYVMHNRGGMVASHPNRSLAGACAPLVFVVGSSIKHHSRRLPNFEVFMKARSSASRGRRSSVAAKKLKAAWRCCSNGERAFARM